MINVTAAAVAQEVKKRKLLMDGAFGTYYGQLYDTAELPELANMKYPERVLQIHKEYIKAGARILRTNTFATNTYALHLSWEEVRENLKAGYRLAKEAAEDAKSEEKEPGRADGKAVYVAADIGQIAHYQQAGREQLSEEYVRICQTFLDEGAELFVFETFSDLEDIRDALTLIGDRAFVIVQFSVNQFGYSQSGLSVGKLASLANSIKEIDAIGLNCGIGPGHMKQMFKKLNASGDKILTALPNAGYPHVVSNRMIFDHHNVEYFADKVGEIAKEGADIIGGCCGTTPEYIRAMHERVSFIREEKEIADRKADSESLLKKDHSFFAGKGGKKLIAVELAPPLGSNDENLMDAAHLLQKSGVDVLTFPDSPSGRTRADSVLMAEKVARETGMCVMPHICCRDKNAIAMRSQLLGAHINHIYNFLVVTGDPVPGMARSSVKSVFNFDSVGLMRIISDMNGEQFGENPVCYGGAINQNRRNLEVEIGRVMKKLDAGATFFLTQPVSTKESVNRLRIIKQETGARILCGIMPFVSLKNALFMKNEMTGIDVNDEVLARYRADMTREEGEAAGIKLAKEMMTLTDDFADGYYFSFPFNRVGMLEKILSE